MSQHDAETQRQATEMERQTAERARQQAETDRQQREEHRQFMEEMRQAAEEMRVAAERMREAAEAVRRLTDERVRQAEAALQHLAEGIMQSQQKLQLDIFELQQAVAEQWRVTNEVAASAQQLLQTAGLLLNEAKERVLNRLTIFNNPPTP
jgi:colicin import membrane protein